VKKVKLSQIGNSTGIVLPKEALAKMNVSKGDSLYLVETPDGYNLTPYENDFDEQMQIAEDVMKRYRNTLRRLGK
jgi:putative addiction module antidote